MIPRRELSAEEQALAREMMKVYEDALPTDSCTWPLNPQAILAVVAAAELRLMENQRRAVPDRAMAEAYDISRRTEGFVATELEGLYFYPPRPGDEKER